MAETIDLLARASEQTGAAWAFAGEQLNATLLSWPTGHAVAEHVNDEREVLLLGVRGSGHVTIDGDVVELTAGRLVVVPRGAARSITAGADGIAYVSAHTARGPLQLRTS